MELTEKQKIGLNIAVERFKNKEKYTVISGYAGTGKSTLVKFIIKALGVNEERDVAYATFTGKAAENLTRKGNKGACTLHKLLYETKLTKDGEYMRFPKVSIDYRVVVVDEVSMVPNTMINLLMSQPDIYILFCGDPGQLPPIDKNDFNGLLDHPHIFLDEIMRQAQDSGIIQLSMKVRAGEPIFGFTSHDAKVITMKDLTANTLLDADMIICATNKTRMDLNRAVRRGLGIVGNKVQDGDKVVCLKNYWEECGSDGNPIVNGSIGYIKNPYPTTRTRPKFRGMPAKQIDFIVGSFESETGEFYNKPLFIDGKKFYDDSIEQITNKEIYNMRSWNITKALIPKDFTFGYAITAWKAQGSQWDNVVIFEERHPYDKEEHKQYMYTAITRAAKNLTVVLR